MFFLHEIKRNLSKNKKPTVKQELGPSPEIIAQVIRTVKKHFIKGPIYAKEHARIKDKSFIRPSNSIPNTNFSATAGPKNADDLIRFFKDTLFRDPPIAYIIAIGNRVSELDTCPAGVDFLNYYMKKKSYDVGPYHVTRKHLGGSYVFHHGHEESKPNIFTESEIIVSTEGDNQRARVIGIELKDGSYIDLNVDPNDQKKEILWKIFKISVEHPVVVHCKHGHGRTGHLILTMEILKNYSTIFSSDDPDVITERILEILNNMRQQRPGLVHGTKQITEAIHNAIVLRRYALEKGYEIPIADNEVSYSHRAAYSV